MKTAAQIFDGKIEGMLLRGESDWYLFSVPRQSNVEIALKFSHKKGDLELKVYDGKGQKIAESRTSGNIEDVRLDFKGKLYIEIYGYKGASNPYNLELKSESKSYNGFIYLGKKTYSCGKITKTVEEYRHKETGMEFVLIPGGKFWHGK